uniref:Myosin binding protein H n=1 Tax=Anas platyrhynchos platyrhynchos TaxID=8840 RepID=U3I3Q8_ANAPP
MTGKTAPPAADPAPAAPKEEPAPAPKEEATPAPAAEETPAPEQPPATEQPPAPTDNAAPVPTAEATPAPEEGSPAPPAEPPAPEPEKPKAAKGMVGVQNLRGTNKDAALCVFVIAEPPGPPQNLKLVDIWGFNVALEWSPPADNGNSEIKGYTVQKSDKKSGKWFTALERCTRTSCTISDLIMGNTYSFRVFAENACGLSEKAAVASGVAHIEKKKTVYQPEKIPERDMMEPPKFTQPLTDRATTRGYNTHLFCSVRGFPQPKIIWMKNQMEIREDPKYIALIDQGVCSLEIRKPGPFDGGVYTCKAVNPLGEASVDCKLDVKSMIC